MTPYQYGAYCFQNDIYLRNWPSDYTEDDKEEWRQGVLDAEESYFGVFNQSDEE